VPAPVDTCWLASLRSAVLGGLLRGFRVFLGVLGGFLGGGGGSIGTLGGRACRGRCFLRR